MHICISDIRDFVFSATANLHDYISLHALPIDKMTDSKYFTTTKKGEIFELKSELNNEKKEKKKEAVKKVNKKICYCMLS